MAPLRRPLPYMGFIALAVTIGCGGAGGGATGSPGSGGGTVTVTGGTGTGNGAGGANGSPGGTGGASLAVCGNGVVEPPEQCDDGNTLPFDGCSPTCQRELDCTRGACAGFCGDGIVEAGEECDDGNTVSGDGCSASCKLENAPGWYCANQTSAPPDTISVPAMFRDFRGTDETSVPGVAACPTGAGPFSALLPLGCAHPDFEAFYGAQETSNLLNGTLTNVSGRPNVLMPSFNTTTGGLHRPSNLASYSDIQITSGDTFAQWYTGVAGVNRTVVSSLTLNRVPGTSTYLIDKSFNNGGFFPLDTYPATYPCPPGQQCSWGTTPKVTGTSNAHDYGFTTETRYQFTYQGGEVLTFTGDDDVWVFIGGKLAVDLGGLHSAVTKTITLDDATGAALGLTKGNIYEIALFHAERHTISSNFTLTLGGLLKNTTVCQTRCGDGIVAGNEQCDLGQSNGLGMGCSATCTVEPRSAQ